MKTPKTLDELTKACEKQEINQSKKCTTPQNATWIEWANVRMSDDYAAFVQDNHHYAFDL